MLNSNLTKAARDKSFKVSLVVLLLVLAAIIALAVALPDQPKWTALPVLVGTPVFYVAQTWAVGNGLLRASGNSWNLKAAAFLVASVEGAVLLCLL